MAKAGPVKHVHVFLIISASFDILEILDLACLYSTIKSGLLLSLACDIPRAQACKASRIKIVGNNSL